MISALDVLLANLDAGYDKRGWHGPSLRGTLRGVSPAEALWRPGKARHNVWELAMHCAYWKYAVWRKVTGAKRGSFPVKGSNFFPAPESANDAAWRSVVRLLDEQHEQLRAAIEALSANALSNRKRVRMIFGAAAHDVYHAGQIQLLKRLQRS